jgi:hypothetical protein
MKVTWGLWIDNNGRRVTDEEEQAIIDSIVENKFKIYGPEHQSLDKGCPYINGGPCAYSFRGWGRIMAKAWNIIENTDKYTYTDFAWYRN